MRGLLAHPRVAAAMAVLGVVLKAVEARRFQDMQPNQQVRIDHNSNLALVEAESDDRLRIDFAYTTSYGPLGVVKLEGQLRVRVEDAAGTAKKWGQDRNLPPELAQQVHGAILQACIPDAVGLAKTIRLPPPIPLPQVQFKRKTADAEAQGSVDSYGSPEVG